MTTPTPDNLTAKQVKERAEIAMASTMEEFIRMYIANLTARCEAAEAKLAKAADELHGTAMNMACQKIDIQDGGDVLWAQGYDYGHRDARHAIAEAISSYFAAAGAAGGEDK